MTNTVQPLPGFTPKKLFDPVRARKPNFYSETERMLEIIWSSHWTPMEFDFTRDYDDYINRLTDQEKLIIRRTLAAIAQIEVAVKTFWAKIGDTIKHPYIQDIGFALASTEVIHNAAYEKLLKRLDLEDIFEENMNEPVIAGRVNYLTKWTRKFSDNEIEQFVYALILFTLFIENVSLFSQFYITTWFSGTKQVLPHTGQQIEYTQKEEALHANFGIYLINIIRKEYPEVFTQELYDRVAEEVEVAFAAESAVIDWILGDFNENSHDIEKANLPEGVEFDSTEPNKILNKYVVEAYIQRRIDDSLERIGFPTHFENDQRRVFDSGHHWATVEEFGNADIDFFDTKSTAYAKGDRSYNIETDVI